MAYDSEFGVYYTDKPDLDAFGRLRVSNPETIFDSKQIFNSQPLFWDDAQTIGSGTSSTYNSNQASTTIAVSAATAGTRVRQTFRRFNYQPGKSQLIELTGVIGAGVSGVTKRLGLFDQNNGVFFQQIGTTVSVAVRTFTSGSAVTTAINQSNWNLDTLDGSGLPANPSGITLDVTKTQIFVIDFQWLGVGRIRYGFEIDGVLIYCHEILNANVNTLVWASLPNLPLRYEISNDGSGGVASLVHICTTVVSEGGRSNVGYQLGTNRGITALTTLNNSSIYPLIAIRLGSSFLAADVVPTNFSIACASNSTFNFYLLLNPTVVGTALSFSAITNSAVEQDITTTNATTLTGGTILFSGTSQQTNESILNVQSPSDIQLGSTIAGVSDRLVLAVQRITGTAETFYGSLNWRETI